VAAREARDGVLECGGVGVGLGRGDAVFVGGSVGRGGGEGGHV
jgi:hypothetical protein